MMKRLITHIKEGTQYHAVELTGTDTEDGLFFIGIQKKKNTLEITEKSDRLNSVALSKKLKKHARLFAVINTPQVLTKIIPAPAGDSHTIIDSAFPNIKTEDFYYEWVRSGNNCMVSVCRKEHVNAILQRFRETGINIAGFSLGILQINTIQAFLPAGSMVLPRTKITLNDNAFEAMEKNEKKQYKTYEINGITLENSYLLGFAAVLSSVLKSGHTHSNFATISSRFLQDFYHRRFFNFFLKFGLGFLLVVLLANFFLFNAYYKKTELLREALALKSADKNKVQALNERVNEKQKRIDAILASSSSKSSFYLDKIAAALPLSVLLNKITYQPVEGQLKQDSEITVAHGILIISGMSTDSNAFSQWVEIMEKWDWVQRVGIRDYDYSNASTSSFTLKIIVENEQ